MMRCWLALLFLLPLAHFASAAGEASAVHMTEPRGFGHFVGDLIERNAEFEVSDGETFVPASLPQPGQLAYWLELRSAEIGQRSRAGRRTITLQLTYQLFYVPIDTRKVRIPPTNIALKGPQGTRVATIPAFTFLISPIREIYPEKSGETTATFLKDDARAEYIRTAPVRTAAAGSALTAALALALLAFHLAWWPFHKRAGRPFTEAQRVVTDHRECYPALLLALHRAFDRSQGHRLLAADVEGFLDVRQEHAAARDAIERFFKASQTYFFAGDAVAAEAAMPRSSLEQLAARLAKNERAAR
jgi:mxaA protein